MSKHARFVLLLAGALLLVPDPALPLPCHVPADRVTIQAASDDAACTEIVLAAGTYTENVTISRSVVLRGTAGTLPVVAGRIEAAGSATVEIEDLLLDDSTLPSAGCNGSLLWTTGTAELQTRRVEVRSGSVSACPLFEDGFETGDSSQWSSTTP